MGLRGNIEELDRLAEQGARLGAVVPKITAKVVEALAPLVAQQVASGSGPDGESWPGATTERVDAIAAKTKVTGKGKRVYITYRGKKGGTKKLHGLTPFVIVPKRDAELPAGFKSVVDEKVQAAFEEAAK